MYDNRTNKEALKKIPRGVTWDFFREVDSASENEYQGFLLG